MFILIRALTYATLFVSLVLVFLPAQVLSWSGAVRPLTIGGLQITGLVAAASGALLVLWCLLTFVVVGQGTPAPFDPPQRLVGQGPYRVVRNPMYLGAGLAVAGAALFYQSLPLLGYAGMFWLATHVFVIVYEESTLRQTFGAEYESYCKQVHRWWPRL